MTDAILNLAVIHTGWACVHFVASHLYSRYCTPWGLFGFLVSPVVTRTVYCQAFRWGIVHGASNVDAFWLTLGTWLASRALRYGPPRLLEHVAPDGHKHE